MQRPSFSLALILSALALSFASPSWARQLVIIEGTGGSWWVDQDSVHPDQEAGVTFYTEWFTDNPGVPPDEARMEIPIGRSDMAIKCETGEQFYYSDSHEEWHPYTEKRSSEYYASIGRIVCKH
jgi:hypothetical protein